MVGENLILPALPLFPPTPQFCPPTPHGLKSLPPPCIFDSGKELLNTSLLFQTKYIYINRDILVAAAVSSLPFAFLTLCVAFQNRPLAKQTLPLYIIPVHLDPRSPPTPPSFWTHNTGLSGIAA